MSVVIKVKRRLEEDPPAVLCHQDETSGRSLYFRLVSKSVGSAQLSTKKPDEMAQKVPEFDATHKRRKVVGSVVRGTTENLCLLDETISDDFTYDYYMKPMTSSIFDESSENFAYLELPDQDLMFLDEDEYRDSDVYPDDEDSNAEDHYANDYPEEFDHIRIRKYSVDFESSTNFFSDSGYLDFYDEEENLSESDSQRFSDETDEDF